MHAFQVRNEKPCREIDKSEIIERIQNSFYRFVFRSKIKNLPKKAQRVLIFNIFDTTNNRASFHFVTSFQLDERSSSNPMAEHEVMNVLNT